ncbi:ElaB/YqjD/DUF883 family membrane-anchored ribosome-binding protein [Loktanella ponticola]|uniref:ElaB/YqjD/DUF883 family membrane-anchored ribosome-binding protein n=1 Tax=Yoonia ponticola TaxID=1524255 RepID=A0A7W9BNY6_9RHOB|nr:DUF883 family protein [Yoonia ponticola]MBB5723981.1 ElaB/YqjD/DUF883 family membrane-anchored ribosome-binding protein [Yoonia ponticola]
MANVSNKSGSNGATATDVSEQLETLRADIGQLTQIIADFGKAKGEDAIAATRHAAESARGKVADQAETARIHALELQDQANDFVQKQPATALGIAAGLGFLVGFLGSRK